MTAQQTTTPVNEFNQDELLIIAIALYNNRTDDPGLRGEVNQLFNKVRRFLKQLG